MAVARKAHEDGGRGAEHDLLGTLRVHEAGQRRPGFRDPLAGLTGEIVGRAGLDARREHVVGNALGHVPQHLRAARIIEERDAGLQGGELRAGMGEMSKKALRSRSAGNCERTWSRSSAIGDPGVVRGGRVTGPSD
jgi:hypothetical protein